MRTILFTAFIGLLAIGFNATADEGYQFNNGNLDVRSATNVYSNVAEYAATHFSMVSPHAHARHIVRGAKPELRIVKNTLLFNNKVLPLGGKIERWRAAIGLGADCTNIARPPIACRWNEYGIKILTDSTGKYVKSIDIYFRLPENPLADLPAILSDGTPNSLDAGHFPNSPFKGYLEIDGFGIDKNTLFWEVRSSVRQERNFKCGLRDCQFPRGLMAPSTHISMSLIGRTENDPIEKISINRVHYN